MASKRGDVTDLVDVAGVVRVPILRDELPGGLVLRDNHTVADAFDRLLERHFNGIDFLSALLHGGPCESAILRDLPCAIDVRQLVLPLAHVRQTQCRMVVTDTLLVLLQAHTEGSLRNRFFAGDQ